MFRPPFSIFFFPFLFSLPLPLLLFGAVKINTKNRSTEHRDRESENCEDKNSQAYNIVWLCGFHGAEPAYPSSSASPPPPLRAPLCPTFCLLCVLFYVLCSLFCSVPFCSVLGVYTRLGYPFKVLWQLNRKDDKCECLSIWVCYLATPPSSHCLAPF